MVVTGIEGELACSIGAVVSSFVAAILAATQGAPGWIAAAFAALPGLCTTLQTVVDFRGRAAW
jgi:hypothetical protein